MYHGWVSGRAGEGLKVRPIEITGKVGKVLVQTSCSEDEFERTLEGEAFVRMVAIAFVIGAIRLPRSDFDWERYAPYGELGDEELRELLEASYLAIWEIVIPSKWVFSFGVCVAIFAELGGTKIGGRGRLVMSMVTGSNVWYIFSTALHDSVSSGTMLAESVSDMSKVS
ncbi:hypothetical protein GIB67_013975 [Kingdonia uniflora]|uniref:Uncharacterized protein n=1 Tax=Kingdonia uniflora TaxID=39325 RepID=A0A7J7LDR1_9MAGN|nr:hypothetical protein GIB67_013975 [Kingdonia uniflora]